MKLASSTLEIHLLIFLGFMLVAAIIGYLIGKRKEAQLNKRILEVETEMLHANSEVLQYAEINKQLTDALEKAKVPLPSIAKHKEEEEKLRSIPLGKIGFYFWLLFDELLCKHISFPASYFNKINTGSQRIDVDERITIIPLLL